MPARHEILSCPRGAAGTIPSTKRPDYHPRGSYTMRFPKQFFGGVLVGLAGAIGGGRFVESVLFGLSATDVWTMSAAIGATVLVSLAAGYLPARRASRVDPMVALRYE